MGCPRGVGRPASLGKGAAMVVDTQSFLRFIYAALLLVMGQFAYRDWSEQRETAPTVAETQPAPQGRAGGFAAFLDELFRGPQE